MYLRPWISKHAWAKFNLGQLVKVQAQELRTPNQWGNHSHISNGTHQLPHIWPFIFTPNISPKPLFLPKIVTQNPVFFTLSRILEIFLSKTPNRLEFEKKVPKCPLFLWLLWLKDPLLFALHTHGLFEGNVAPSNTVRSWKILYSRNRIVQFGEYFQVQI